MKHTLIMRTTVQAAHSQARAKGGRKEIERDCTRINFRYHVCMYISLIDGVLHPPPNLCQAIAIRYITSSVACRSGQCSRI
jgi:hypothetical protein